MLLSVHREKAANNHLEAWHAAAIGSDPGDATINAAEKGRSVETAAKTIQVGYGTVNRASEVNQGVRNARNDDFPAPQARAAPPRAKSYPLRGLLLGPFSPQYPIDTSAKSVRERDQHL
jgi:hypothetical protein